MIHKKNYFYFIIIFLSFLPIYASCHNAQPNHEETLPKTGNFILPSTQQPGALVGFGQNVINKNQLQFFVFADDFKGTNQQFIDTIPGIVYGITDNLSIFLNVPIAARYQQDKTHSSGIEDVFLQLEYSFYFKQTSTFYDQATLVGNVSFPSGSTIKQPATGFGSYTFFLGTTFERTYKDWFLFTAYGALFTTAHHGTKFGNELFYQYGLGCNMFDLDSKWIFAWLTEIDGFYTGKSRINGLLSPDSGGNVVYITPSLWISSKNIIIQFGTGWVISQHLFGNQHKNSYLLVANFGWTIF